MWLLLFVLVLNDCNLFVVIVLCRLTVFFDLCFMYLCRCLVVCFWGDFFDFWLGLDWLIGV